MVIGLLAVRGAVRGVFREAFALAALLAGAAVSVVWGETGAGWVANRWGLAPVASRAAAHALLFLVPYVVLQTVGYGLHRLGRSVHLGGLDRAAGAAFGLVAGVLLVGAAAAAAAQTSWGEEWVRSTRLARPLLEVFERALAWADRLGS